MKSDDRQPRPDDVRGADPNMERAAIDGIDASQARSDGQHAVFVDDMAEGIAFHSAIRDETGHIVDFLVEYANQAFGRLVDRAHDELVGRRMLGLFPAWADGLFDICVQAVQTGQPRTGESLPEQRGLERANANGHTLSVEISISRLGDGCATSLRDVTARRRVEDELFRSQVMLRSVLDTFPQRVFWKDRDSVFVGCNAAFARNIRLADPLNIVGKTDFDIHTPSDAEMYRADDQEIMRSGMARIEYEEPMTRTDGTDGWARTSKVPIRDKDGQVIGLLGAYQDITDQRWAQEALRESERFLDSVIENIPDMIFVKDAEGLRFVRFNRAGEELLGYTREELTGKSDHDLFPQQEADFFTRKDEEVLRGRQVFDIPEETIRTRYRGERVLHTKKIPLLDERGNPEYLLGISEDITERKRAEEERLARLRFAEGMDRVNRAILGTDDLDHMMRDALAVVLELFGCDRAFLFYPCDPDALTFRVPMEVTNPEYPGAGMLNLDMPLSPDMAENLREALESAGPVTYVAGTARPINRASAEQFGVQSLMVSALYPKSDKPWAFGIHQCSHPRVWTSEDESLFKEIGRRLADALTSLLARRDLQRSEGEYRRIVDTASEGIWVVGPDDATSFVNARMADMLGRSTNDMIGRPLTDFMFEEDAPDHARRIEARSRGISETYERRFRCKDGQPLWTHVSATPIFEDEDRFAGSFAMLTDITERRRVEEEARTLEAELRQSQKMEAVGQLAGGIAHDFNNLITAIRGYSEFVRESLPPGDRDDIDQVVLAADRAAELTRQLLAFSRRQVLQPRVLAPAEIVDGIAPMLRRLLGEHIELMVQTAPDAGRIRVDPSKLEQVIVNLGVNARDAMPGGGRLTIETTNAEIDVRFEPNHAEMTPGPYVVLSVTDTGCGMDEETLARVFEPFFTTKEPGSGTGMGLATVYGIVRQSGGQIYLDSELGHGTTFAIYLPRVDQEVIAAAVATEAAAVPRGSETILLVEDEASVRTFARRALEGLGYTVLEATNGAEAAALATEHTGRIDLVVTDVVMPRMGGRELAERLRLARPDLAILFMSGFSGNAMSGADLSPPGAPVLAKPFTREGLGRAVRGALAVAE